MKSILLITLWLVTAVGSAHGQGILVFANPFAPTRIGTPEGPLAGPDIYAQLLVGLTMDTLMPVGTALPHHPLGDGFVRGGSVEVPGIPPLTLVYVQMVVWDSTFWGTELASVPEYQLGLTSVDPVFLSGPGELFSPGPPSFDSGAVVPPIPEPSTWALLVLGAGIFSVRRWLTHTVWA